MTKTLEHKFLQAGGRPTGFDYLRLFGACAVVCMHSVRVSYGSDAWLWLTPMGAVLKMLIPMYFALSGFLVAGSLERTSTVGMFVGLRLIRIYPALTVEVLLSAFVLGAIYTSYPLAQYFTNNEFILYVMNLTGVIHYFLPGVFQRNPDVGFVNVQLWTVPWELKCYALLTCLFIFGIKRWKILAPIAAFGLMFGTAIHWLYQTHSLLQAAAPGVQPGTLMVDCFLFGVSFYLYKDRIPHSLPLFLASLILCLAMNACGSLGDNFGAPLVAYGTIFVGLTSPRKIRILEGADYSYGIYLYGYPIQQFFATFGSWTHHWYLSILFCLPMSVMFAAFSWYCIEKPAYRLRSVLRSIEKFYLAGKAGGLRGLRHVQSRAGRLGVLTPRLSKGSDLNGVGSRSGYHSPSD